MSEREEPDLLHASCNYNIVDSNRATFPQYPDRRADAKIVDHSAVIPPSRRQCRHIADILYLGPAPADRLTRGEMGHHGALTP